MIKKFLAKICFLVIVFNFPLIRVANTNAILSDEEESLGNSIQSSFLDLTLRSGQSNFVPSSKADELKPGESVARDIYVGKTSGSVDLKHSVSFEYLDGDTDFCNQLQLKLWYNHYNCDPSGGYACRDMRLKYNGSLSGLLNFKDSDFVVLHPDDLFDTNPADGVEQWFYYSLSLPEGLDTSFTDKTCKFNFIVKSWQIDSDGTWGYLDQEKLESTITSGEWIIDETAPEALISTPLDPYYNGDFTIDFSATDVDGNVSSVSLYYNYNGGDWQFLYENTGYASALVNDSFTVDLDDLLGDGNYEFMTIATDDSGNVEADSDSDGALSTSELSFVSFEEATAIDTNSPLTMLSVGQTMAVANDSLYNGGFENGNLDGWNIDSNGSDHQATTDESNSGNNSALLGFRDSSPSTDNAYDSISQTVSLPSSGSTLSFWYHLLTNDNSSGGFFDVTVFSPTTTQAVAHDGWDDPLVSAVDLGWENVTYQLNGFEGNDVTVEFKVTQPDELYKTWAYVDDVRVCSVENYLQEGEPIELNSTDSSGSGVSTTYYSTDGGVDEEYLAPIDLPEGGHSIDYYSQDEAGNTENVKTMTITVVSEEVEFDVVLNEFMPNPSGSDDASKPDGEWVKLYNNSQNPIDVDGWVLYDLEDDHELVISTDNSDNNDNVTDSGETIVPAEGVLTVYRDGDSDFILNNSGGDEVRLYDAPISLGGILVDSFEYKISAITGKSFKRDPDGTGTWKDPIPDPVLLVSYDDSSDSVGFTVSNLLEFEELRYEIVYQSDEGLDGASGKVSLSGEDSFSRQGILLGVCSSSDCVLDEGVREVNFKIMLFGKDETKEFELSKALKIDL